MHIHPTSVLFDEKSLPAPFLVYQARAGTRARTLSVSPVVPNKRRAAEVTAPAFLARLRSLCIVFHGHARKLAVSRRLRCGRRPFYLPSPSRASSCVFWRAHRVARLTTAALTYPSAHLLGGCVRQELVASSKTYVRDGTCVSSQPLLLFGGALKVEHKEGVIVMDEWLHVKSQGKRPCCLQPWRCCGACVPILSVPACWCCQHACAGAVGARVLVLCEPTHGMAAQRARL